MTIYHAHCGCLVCTCGLKAMFDVQPIQSQIDSVVGLISDYDLIELLPVLKTLQKVRDGQGIQDLGVL